MYLALVQFPVVDLNLLVLSVFLLLGLFALGGGGQLLTRGAVGISANLSIDPLIVGLTVVSIATSMPEFSTTLMAAESHPGLALGNILGSNIANTGLILGIAALLVPLKVKLRLVEREVPILILVTVVFGLMIFSEGLGRIEGLILLAATVSYLLYMVRKAREEHWSPMDDLPKVSVSTLTAFGLVVLGGLFLALGADLLVQSSAEIASRMGVSDVFIGFTVVAIGTSLPELAACIAAVRAGQGDLCAGNIVGSNLFNLLLIGGGAAALKELPFAFEEIGLEYFAALLLTICLLWFVRSGHTVTRREGCFLLLFYLAFIALVTLQQYADFI
jgi:cation:H+ antiporter